MDEEFKALQVNKTWELVILKKNMMIIVNKWVYKVKYNPDEIVSEYKARLVAKRYHQNAGMEYNETLI